MTEMTRQLLQSPGDDCLTPILSAIKAARATIRVIDYAFVWPDLADALIAAHQGGVDVRLVLDKTQAAGHSERPEIDQLRAAQLPLVVGHSERGHIVHDKVIVIDGHLVVRGSFNLTRTAQLEDNFVEIDSGNPVWAQAFTDEFDRLWKRMVAPVPAAQVPPAPASPEEH